MAMDDTFQFIIESPQNTQGQKKRPRLVTSCDNCRLKKIKCIQPNPESKCEACKQAKIACRFKDREKYFAERSRAIASPPAGNAGYVDERYNASNHGQPEWGSNPAALRRSETAPEFSIPSASSSPALSHADPRSSSRSPKASGFVAADPEYSRYQPYPVDPRRSRHAGSSSLSIHSRSNSGNSVPSYEYAPPPPSGYSAATVAPYMPHLIQLFFDNHGQDYPFLSQQVIMQEYYEGRLHPALANCIAELGSRYSTMPEFTSRGYSVAHQFNKHAKSFVGTIRDDKSLPYLHALMLLAWSEYHNNNAKGFQEYAKTAVQLAMEMGLHAEYVPNLTPDEIAIRRLTYTNIRILYNATVQVRS